MQIYSSEIIDASMEGSTRIESSMVTCIKLSVNGAEMLDSQSVNDDSSVDIKKLSSVSSACASDAFKLLLDKLKTTMFPFAFDSNSQFPPNVLILKRKKRNVFD